MDQGPSRGENEPSGEFGSIVSGVMLAQEQTRLTREMIRGGWQMFWAARCQCGGRVMWNPSRAPNTLVCIRTACPCYGETPEQNQALFKEEWLTPTTH